MIQQGRGKFNPHRYNKSRVAKLKAADVMLIKRRLAIGETARKLASEFGVSEAAICDIRKGRNWGWVSPDPIVK